MDKNFGIKTNISQALTKNEGVMSIEEIKEKLKLLESNIGEAVDIDNRLAYLDISEKVLNFLKNKKDAKRLKDLEEQIFKDKDVVSKAFSDEGARKDVLGVLLVCMRYSGTIPEYFQSRFADKDRRDKFQDFTNKIFLENIHVISNEMSSSDMITFRCSLNLFSRFLSNESINVNKLHRTILEQNTTPDQEEFKKMPEVKDFFVARDVFVGAQPLVEENIKKAVEIIKEDESLFAYYKPYFDLCAKRGLLTETTNSLIAEIYGKSRRGIVSTSIAEDIVRKDNYYTNKSTENTKNESTLGEMALQKVGFSEKEARDLIESWLSTNTEVDESLENKKQNQISIIDNNLEAIKGLENLRAGSAKYLLSAFGIRCFSRYSNEELIKQYDEREDTRPYGVFFQAVADWNGAFNRKGQSELVRKKIEDNGLLMRVIEANGKIDLAKKLLSLHEKYNQKIKFMYVSAHGNTDVMGFGGNRESNSSMFLQDDLKGKGVQKIKELFSENAQVALASCLTGTKGGLAEEIANTYKVKVIAADKVTTGNPKYIDIQRNEMGDNVNFEIKFNTLNRETEKNRKGTVVYEPNS